MISIRILYGTIICLLRLCSDSNLFCIKIFCNIFWACLTWKILPSELRANFFMCDSFFSLCWRILKFKSLQLFGKWWRCIVQSFYNRIGCGIKSFLLFIKGKSCRKLLILIFIFYRNGFYLRRCYWALIFLTNTTRFCLFLFYILFN